MVERLRVKSPEVQDIWDMSLPDLWVASQEAGGPLPELASMRDWGRFCEGGWKNRLDNLRTLYHQAPWGKTRSILPSKGEAIFWTWFALHDSSKGIRRFCTALLTIPQGSVITGKYAARLSETGEKMFTTLEYFRELVLSAESQSSHK